jgi:hypothetical protein
MARKRHRPGRSLYVRQDTKALLADLARHQGISLARLVGSLAIGMRDRMPERWRSGREAQHVG